MSATSRPKCASGSTPGSTRAACWCASPVRGLRRPTTISFRCKLRRGGRTLGGSLTWEKPQQLAALLARRPVRRHGRARRTSPSTARCWPSPMRCSPPHLGDARRRHAAGHRRAARQGHDRPVPCHRRHALVGPADVRHLRRDAATRRRLSGYTAKPGAGVAARRPPKRWRRPACSTASARSARRPPTAQPVPADYRDRATPTIRPASTVRRKDCSP